MAKNNDNTLEQELSRELDHTPLNIIYDLDYELNYLARTHGKVSTTPLNEVLLNNNGKLNPATFKKALGLVKPYGEKRPFDDALLLKKIIAKYKDFAGFLESYATSTTLLFLNEYGKIPAKDTDTYKELEACYERIKLEKKTIYPTEGKPFYMLEYDDTKHGGGIHQTPLGNKMPVGGDWYGYILRADQAKLLALIDKLPKSNKAYSVALASGEQSNLLVKTARLCNELKISPVSDKDPSFKLADGDNGNDPFTGYYSASIAFTYLIDAVSIIYEQKVAKEKEYRKAPNIAGDHTVVGLPTTLALNELLLHNAEREYSTLATKYRTKEAQEADNGFSGLYDNAQASLDGVLTIDDLKTSQKIVRNFVAMQYRALGAFISYKKDNPETDTVVLSELAKYTPWAKEVKTKGLKPEHRNALLNGLKIASLYSYKYTTGVSYEKVGGRKQKVYNNEYVYILKRIKSDKTTENGTVLSVKTDFDPTYLKALHLNTGVAIDNLSYIKNETTIVVGGFILSRFVQKQKDISERQKPLRVRAETLCKQACLTDQNTTNRYKNLTKILDELVEGKVIGSWANSKGKRWISTQDEDTLSLDIYPIDPTMYTTPKQSLAKKNFKTVSQERALKMLNELANPKKCYVDLDKLAKDLYIKRRDLEMYFGGLEIPDETIDAIEQLYAEVMRD